MNFLLWFDHKYHANILCQCVLAVLPRIPGSEEDYRRKENEVDFTLQKCNGEFYNFLANFLLHSCAHYTMLQNLWENKNTNFQIHLGVSWTLILKENYF